MDIQMVFTFYSFKGGVGRSTALVKTGEVLYRVGLHVLLVDFDLEAPSLETFFPHCNTALLNTPGVMDLLQAYKHAVASLIPPSRASDSGLPFEGIRSSMTNVGNVGSVSEANGGSLHLITVGRRDAGKMEEYVNEVGRIDWKDFYENWEGELYFRWLRDQFHIHADVTLIYCRTGVTELGRICCFQIADCIVAFCSQSKQQIEGTAWMLRTALSSKLEEARGAPLSALVIPSRIDASELELQLESEKIFEHTFEQYLPKEVRPGDLWQARIPYVPFYTVRAPMVLGHDPASDELAKPYAHLAGLLSRMAPVDSSLYAAQSRLKAVSLATM
jgi:hypothetical protein